MNNYRTYTADEFAQDDYFRQWVQCPTAETDAFWADFQRQYPECQSAVIRARAFLRAVEQTHVLPTPLQRDRLWGSIQQRIKETETIDEVGTVRVRRISFWQSWVAAAVIVLVLGLGWRLIRKSNSIPESRTATSWDSAIEEALIEKRNGTKQPLLVSLSDGSRLSLQPGSQVRYPERFSVGKREVYLEGEGFFEVTKNPQSPFIVYANGLVTQVVGTSFTVKALPNVSQVSVAVRTGKVAVYTLKALQQSQQMGSKIANMLLLTPNQQAVLNLNNGQITRRLVDEPVLLAKLENNQYFVFDGTPIIDVFQKLERAYGVTIQYDSTAFSGCRITAPLGNEPLFRKLDIICQTIGATYEVWGTHILVSGPGCQTPKPNVEP